MEDKHPSDNKTVAIPKKASNQQSDYDTATTKECTDDEDLSWEQSGPIIDENILPTTLPSLTAFEISISAVTHIMPIIIPPPIAIPMRSNVWKTLVQANNMHQLPIAATIFDQSKVTTAVKYDISDSGATGHFLLEGAPVVKKQVTENPITITLPTGKVIQLIHTHVILIFHGYSIK